MSKELELPFCHLIGSENSRLDTDKRERERQSYIMENGIAPNSGEPTPLSRANAYKQNILNLLRSPYPFLTNSLFQAVYCRKLLMSHLHAHLSHFFRVKYLTLIVSKGWPMNTPSMFETELAKTYPNTYFIVKFLWPYSPAGISISLWLSTLPWHLVAFSSDSLDIKLLLLLLLMS